MDNCGCTYEGCDDGTHDQCYDIAPYRKCNVLLDDNDKSENETDGEYYHVPPPRRFFIVFIHVHVVRAAKDPFSSGFERPNNVTAPEQNDVSNQGSDLGYVSDLYSRFTLNLLQRWP